MWIMIAGPYSSGARSERERRHNLSELNRVAVQLFESGHIPVIGVNMALPMIAEAGPDSFETLMMPISLALAERCDACLRVGGASVGADQEVDVFRKAGKRVFTDIDQVPGTTAAKA